jgi:CHAT domain-containing protein/Tfp pilus assembly protein PilF
MPTRSAFLGVGCWIACVFLLPSAGASQALAPATSQTAAPSVVTELEALRARVRDGHAPQAEGRLRELLAAVEEKDGPESSRAADVLDVLVEALERDNHSQEAETLQLAQRAVGLREKFDVQDSPELAVSLVNLARVQRDRGDFAAARPYFERVLAIRTHVLGPTDPQIATDLDDLAIDLRQLGEFAAAKQHFERALAIRRQRFGAQNVEMAKSLNYLGMVAMDMGDYADARQHYARALEIRERVFGKDDPLVAQSVNMLAALLFSTGDYPESRRLYQRALAIREKTLGPEDPLVAETLHNLAVLLNAEGDYVSARPLCERSLRIRRKTLGEDSPFVASSLHLLAGLLTSTGDYAQALPLYERTLKIWRQSSPDHPKIAQALGNMAVVLHTMGDDAEAKADFELALEIRQARLRPDHPDVARSSLNLAEFLEDTGRYSEAKPLLERALSVLEKTLGGENHEVAWARIDMAIALGKTGDRDGAHRLFSEAVPAYEKALSPGATDAASALNIQAEFLAEGGEYAAARRIFQRADTILSSSLGPNYGYFPLAARNLEGLAEVLYEEGDVAPAFEAALKCEGISRDHLRLTSRTLTERQALRYASVRASGLDIASTLAAQGSGQAPADGRRAFDALIRSRALVLDEMAARQHLVEGSRDPEIARLATALTSARQRLANLAVRGRDDDSPDVYRALLDRARREKENTEHALAAKSAGFRRQQELSRVGLDEVGRALPVGSALVSFSRYARLPLRDSLGAPERTAATHASDKIPAYLAYVLRAGDTQVDLIRLGDAQGIEALVSCWRREASGRTESTYRVAADSLRRRIWDPIEPRLAGVRRVFIVPDGALQLVSFAALPTGERSYIVETGPVLHYLSTERDLVREQTPKGQGLLAVGGADFDAAPRSVALKNEGGKTGGISQRGLEVREERIARADPEPIRNRGAEPPAGDVQRDFSSVRFKPLPGSAREVDDVASLWGMMLQVSRRQRSSHAATAGCVQLTGAAASEAAIKQLAPGKRVLHLATHGYFLGEGRGLGGAGRGMGLVTPRDEGTAAATSDNPLLLSGLAFAGANLRASAGANVEDGILTAEEIAGLDLSGVEWAVLSACDTGLGEVRAGEGVFGLRRAFQVAGAGTLIMSLWSVDDEATRRWVHALYAGRLLKGLGTAEAVQAADLEMLRGRIQRHESTHPFYWAGFVASGNWQ